MHLGNKSVETLNYLLSQTHQELRHLQNHKSICVIGYHPEETCDAFMERQAVKLLRLIDGIKATIAKRKKGPDRKTARRIRQERARAKTV